jgi:UDP-N-acetylglucosamine acyltransferase
MESDLYETLVRNKIHSSAFIDPSVIIGTGNIICEGVIIRSGVQIGDNNYIGPYCIIGDFAEKNAYFHIQGKVLIGSNNRFTKQVTVDAGTEGPTIVKNNCILLKNAHVGHDAYIHDDVTLSCNAMIGGFTEVKRGCNIGLGAAIHQRLTIPENVMVGMNAAVTKKTVLQPNRKYAGVPARDIGSNER